jgi:periplasmic protein TonB
VPLRELPDAFEFVLDDVDVPEEERHEPVFSTAALAVRVATEVRRLDPARTDFELDATPPKPRFWRGPLGSLLIHLLPLLVLIGWPGAPLDIDRPIPIQLVIEPPPKPAPPAAPRSPPKGMIASDDMAPMKGPKNQQLPAASSTEGEAPPTQPTPVPQAPVPASPQLSSALQPPNPNVPELPVAEAVPDEPVAPAARPSTPENQPPTTAPPPPPKPAPPRQEAALRPPLRSRSTEGWPLPVGPAIPRETPARTSLLVGPNATRDEYCAYALTLVMKHIDMVPLSLLGARRGDTDIAIKVLDDGTIAGVRISHGSGYMDIDDRIAQMVLAVGHFPPLPEWIRGRSLDFIFHMHFPYPTEH